jgi:hypothetical protein
MFVGTASALGSNAIGLAYRFAAGCRAGAGLPPLCDWRRASLRHTRRGEHPDNLYFLSSATK